MGSPGVGRLSGPLMRLLLHSASAPCRAAGPPLAICRHIAPPSPPRAALQPIEIRSSRGFPTCVRHDLIVRGIAGVPGGANEARPPAAGSRPSPLEKPISQTLRRDSSSSPAAATPTAAQQALSTLRSIGQLPKQLQQLTARLPSLKGIVPSQVWIFLQKSRDQQDKVLSLHLNSFYNSHGRTVSLLACGGAALLAWKLSFGMCSLAGATPSMSLSAYTLAFSAAGAYASLLLLRHHFAMHPDKIHSTALQELNCHAGVLEAMGAPVVGSGRQAFIMSGGGLDVKRLVPSLTPQHLYMVFPLHGSLTHGTVLLSATKSKGKVALDLLAVDIPCSRESQVRVYLAGGPREFESCSAYEHLCKSLET